MAKSRIGTTGARAFFADVFRRSLGWPSALSLLMLATTVGIAQARVARVKLCDVRGHCEGLNATTLDRSASASRTASIQVAPGTVAIGCTSVRFGGACSHFAVGTHSVAGPPRSFASMQIIDAAPVTVCKGQSLQPPCFALSTSVVNLGAASLVWSDGTSMNDSIRSIKVRSDYKVEAFSLPGHLGATQEFDPAVATFTEWPNLAPAVDAKISSLIIGRGSGPVLVCQHAALLGECLFVAGTELDLTGTLWPGGKPVYAQSAAGAPSSTNVSSARVFGDARAVLCPQTDAKGVCSKALTPTYAGPGGVPYLNLTSWDLDGQVRSLVLQALDDGAPRVHVCAGASGPCQTLDGTAATLDPEVHQFADGTPLLFAIQKVVVAPGYRAALCAGNALTDCQSPRSAGSHMPLCWLDGCQKWQVASIEVMSQSQAPAPVHLCSNSAGYGMCTGVREDWPSLAGRTWSNGTSLTNLSPGSIIVTPGYQARLYKGPWFGGSEVQVLSTPGYAKPLLGSAVQSMHLGPEGAAPVAVSFISSNNKVTTFRSSRLNLVGYFDGQGAWHAAVEHGAAQTFAHVRVTAGYRVTLCSEVGLAGTCARIPSALLPADLYTLAQVDQTTGTSLTESLGSFLIEREDDLAAYVHACRGPSLTEACEPIAGSMWSTAKQVWDEDGTSLTASISSLLVQKSARICTAMGFGGQCTDLTGSGCKSPTLGQASCESATTSGQHDLAAPYDQAVASIDLLEGGQPARAIACSEPALEGDCVTLARIAYATPSAMGIGEVGSIGVASGQVALAHFDADFPGQPLELAGGPTGTVQSFTSGYGPKSLLIDEALKPMGLQAVVCDEIDFAGRCAVISSARPDLFADPDPAAPWTARSVHTVGTTWVKLCSAKHLQGTCAIAAGTYASLATLGLGTALSVDVALNSTFSARAYVCKGDNLQPPCAGLESDLHALDGRSWSDGTSMLDSVSSICTLPDFEATLCSDSTGSGVATQIACQTYPPAVTSNVVGTSTRTAEVRHQLWSAILATHFDPDDEETSYNWDSYSRTAWTNDPNDIKFDLDSNGVYIAGESYLFLYAPGTDIFDTPTQITKVPGCDHPSGLSVFGDYVYVAFSNCAGHRSICRLDKGLSVHTCSLTHPDQEDASFLAINPRDGLIYSGGGDGTHRVFAYQRDFSQATLQLAFAVELPQSYVWYQGGAFSANGYFYLSQGKPGATSDAGLHVFRFEGTQATWLATIGLPFYQGHCVAGINCWELEGVSVQAMKYNGFDSDIQWLFLNNQADTDNVRLVHYQVDDPAGL